MCVYDDVEGWNKTILAMGLGESLIHHMTSDYYITVPSEMIVYGSGGSANWHRY